MRLRSLVAALLIGTALVTSPACSTLNPGDSPSTKVLSEVQTAQTAYLTAITIINIRHSQGKIDAATYVQIQIAENIVNAYLNAAKDAALKGDTVTAQQKLFLFNDALIEFNKQYAASVQQ
jgi:hypothetical protein